MQYKGQKRDTALSYVSAEHQGVYASVQGIALIDIAVGCLLYCS